MASSGAGEVRQCRTSRYSCCGSRRKKPNRAWLDANLDGCEAEQLTICLDALRLVGDDADALATERADTPIIAHAAEQHAPENSCGVDQRLRRIDAHIEQAVVMRD